MSGLFKYFLQVYLDEGLPQLVGDEELLSITGSELAESCNMNFDELESAAGEVRNLAVDVLQKSWVDELT